MRKILVPTDFSLCAEKAINFAVQSAKFLPAEIILHHAFDLQGDVYTDYMGVTREYNQSLLNEVVNRLNGIKNSILKTQGVTVETLVTNDSLKKAIKEVTDTNDIDLIIMGTLGASGIKEILFGSKTSSIIGSSRIPVLVIPSDFDWKKPEKILFATNHFEKNATTLDLLFEMAGLFLSKIDVIVFTDEEEDKAGTVVKYARALSEYEQMIREKYSDPAFTATQIFGLDFIQDLQNYVAKNKIDMLAMVTHKRNFFEKIFSPSLTRQMSYYTKIPLLAIPSGEKE